MQRRARRAGWGTVLLLALVSCARMGSPDGGWYDEKPPCIVSTTPRLNATGVTDRKIAIRFDEYVKLESASEKVMVSPPQLEQPDIKVAGKNIYIKLQDSLKSATTYTIDFSDAITDNNEGNPLGNYTFSFSTGDTIDTLEVSGTVLNAEDLEPVKGILVGLFADGDTLMRRVARTNSMGHFVIRGVAPGSYVAGAVLDADGDYRFTQRSEKMAFSHDTIVPTCMGDTRQDTVWADKLHIKEIRRTGYTHFLPDNIVLRAFDHASTERHFLKAERKEADHFTLFFTAPVDTAFKEPLPLLTGMNFSEKEVFIVEPSADGDTVTYWLRDSTLINKDTLTVAMTTYQSDTLGVQRLQSDTIEILSKVPYAKRLKEQRKAAEEWHKALAKKMKREGGEANADTVMPRELLKPEYSVLQAMSPEGSIHITFPSPLERMDTARIHLYVEQDSLWYRAPYTIKPTGNRTYEMYAEWIQGARYSFEVDSLAFTDIYGKGNARFKSGIRVQTLDEFGSLFMEIKGAPDDMPVLVQLLDKTDKPLRTVQVREGMAEFYYLATGQYYLRAIVDANGNGRWDTGEYSIDRQPEMVYYYPYAVDCKVKWDITKTWNLTATPLERQKPAAIIQQKADAEKSIKQRNAERARSKGIELPEYLR